MEKLPPGAQARMDEIRQSGTWGSALTTNEFAAVRAVGFEPVGQVLGCCVYHLGYTAAYQCPGAWSGIGYTSSSSTRYAAFAPLVQAMYQARWTAMERMTAECTALGGDGVVGVRLAIQRFPAGGLEFQAIGTAVRAVRTTGATVRLNHPFTSHVTGQEFAKLVMNDWIPVSLVLGIAIGTRHDDWWTRLSTRRWSGNQEVAGYTDLVNRTRADSRRELAKNVAHAGADGVVVSSMNLEISERECPVTEGQRDHICEATTIGTAIARFKTTRQAPATGSLAIMSLDPERRAARRAETSLRYL